MPEMTPEMQIALANPAMSVNLSVVFVSGRDVRLSLFEHVEGHSSLRGSFALALEDWDALVDSVARVRKERAEGKPALKVVPIAATGQNAVTEQRTVEEEDGA